VLSGLLTGYQAAGETEAAELKRMTILAESSQDPWSRALPLHFTASALVVHPQTRRVLLRWHAKHQCWLQVGGHGDPGEHDPLLIALREAREETGLTDLVPWPDATLRHVAVCHVPANAVEPQHEHADLRFLLATNAPDAIVPEDDASPLRWVTVAEARSLVGDNNLRHTLDRAEALLSWRAQARPSARGPGPSLLDCLIAHHAHERLRIVIEQARAPFGGLARAAQERGSRGTGFC
jgi:8-oxo-dGTP pyrophosphatase MutT (NUDIX family)